MGYRFNELAQDGACALSVDRFCPKRYRIYKNRAGLCPSLPSLTLGGPNISSPKIRSMLIVRRLIVDDPVENGETVDTQKIRRIMILDIFCFVQIFFPIFSVPCAMPRHVASEFKEFSRPWPSKSRLSAAFPPIRELWQKYNRVLKLLQKP